MKLKSEYAKRLIENGIKPYSVVRHSYTNNRLNNSEENLKRVESKEIGLSPTLDTRCDCLGVAVKDSEYTETEKQLFTRGGEYKTISW